MAITSDAICTTWLQKSRGIDSLHLFHGSHFIHRYTTILFFVKFFRLIDIDLYLIPLFITIYYLLVIILLHILYNIYHIISQSNSNYYSYLILSFIIYYIITLSYNIDHIITQLNSNYSSYLILLFISHYTITYVI